MGIQSGIPGAQEMDPRAQRAQEMKHGVLGTLAVAQWEHGGLGTLEMAQWEPGVLEMEHGEPGTLAAAQWEHGGLGTMAMAQWEPGILEMAHGEPGIQEMEPGEKVSGIHGDLAVEPHENL